MVAPRDYGSYRRQIRGIRRIACQTLEGKSLVFGHLPCHSPPTTTLVLCMKYYVVTDKNIFQLHKGTRRRDDCNRRLVGGVGK